jgi:hypothetical protein
MSWSFDCNAFRAAASLSSTVVPQPRALPVCAAGGEAFSARVDGGAASSARTKQIRSEEKRRRNPNNFPPMKS